MGTTGQPFNFDADIERVRGWLGSCIFFDNRASRAEQGRSKINYVTPLPVPGARTVRDRNDRHKTDRMLPLLLALLVLEMIVIRRLRQKRFQVPQSVPTEA